MTICRRCKHAVTRWHKHHPPAELLAFPRMAGADLARQAAMQKQRDKDYPKILAAWREKGE